MLIKIRYPLSTEYFTAIKMIRWVFFDKDLIENNQTSVTLF